MKIYNYNGTSGEYLTESTAKPNPLEAGAFLIPANATAIKSPKAKDGFALVFEGGAWKHVIDQRNAVYWLADGTKHTITDLGVEKPDGALVAPPPPTVETLQEAIRAECKRRICAAYGEETIEDEILHRLNGNATAEQDTERARLIAKCTELKASVAAMDEDQRTEFNASDDVLAILKTVLNKLEK